MQTLPLGKSISVIRGSILEANTDAIVNAANRSLLGGGGVDGVIHRAAGPELKEYCRKLGGCETGFAKPTPAFQLPFKLIIHAVGPVWKGGRSNEETLLGSAYKSAIVVAEAAELRSLAFPAISTGAYSYPLGEASEIAISAISDALPACTYVYEVEIFCIDKPTHSAFRRATERLLGSE